MSRLNPARARGILVVSVLLLLTSLAGLVAARHHRPLEPITLAVVEPETLSDHAGPLPAAPQLAMAQPPATLPAADLQPSIIQAAIAPAVISQATTPTFDGRPLRHAGTLRMRVTAYSPDERSCGKWADGFTASGYSVWTNGMKLVAADTSVLPMKSILTIAGYNQGRPVQVLDRGGAIKGNRLDVLMPTHEQALQWGVRWIEVDVWEWE